jgi:hypothetical protein
VSFYRKRTVVIEAIRWTGDNYPAVAEWISDRGGMVIPHLPFQTLVIPTMGGDMRATAGDWIIRGVKGEFYPCKPDIFELTYELDPEMGVAYR